MLVSALNSHPEISCEHQDGDIPKSEGNIKGRAVKFLLEKQGGKIIYLARNAKDRIDSLSRLGINRTEKRENRHENRHAKFLSGKDYIAISYEDMTGNKNIKQIPEGYSNMICDYLGVEKCILTTSYVKPDR